MAKPNLDWHGYRFDLLCPSCGYKDLQLLGEMVGKDSIPCRACGESIDISGDERQTVLKKVRDGIRDLNIMSY